ncbi:MAG: DNA-directed RNA polymerase subunit H [Candidatus Micrarchaeota archaeon]|nr:MAG: DNA-directed RNA polymerase subunit H [Candidatus Micrarchaeota archaeon]
MNDSNFIPEHRLLSKDEEKELLNKLNTSKKALPKILVTDPQAVKLKAKVGDIIEIKRNENGASYLFYRVVVPSPEISLKDRRSSEAKVASKNKKAKQKAEKAEDTA